MKPYIFGKRNTIHIIDIRETVKGLLRAKKFLAMAVARGEDVLFVGTKRQAKHHVRAQAERVGMPFVAERWLGGTLTNFRTIRSRVGRLEELESDEASGAAQEYSKKMMATRARELRKIKRNLEGIRNMTGLPGALIVIDVHREQNALREARKLNIPTACLIDTDSDPDFADLPIPGNDDAMRAIETVLIHLADAIEEGLKGRKAPEPDEASKASRQRLDRPTTARSDDVAPKPDRPEASAGETITAAGEPREGLAPPAGPDAAPGLTPATATEPGAATGGE